MPIKRTSPCLADCVRRACRAVEQNRRQCMSQDSSTIVLTTGSNGNRFESTSVEAPRHLLQCPGDAPGNTKQDIRQAAASLHPRLSSSLWFTRAKQEMLHDEGLSKLAKLSRVTALEVFRSLHWSVDTASCANGKQLGKMLPNLSSGQGPPCFCQSPHSVPLR